jgi:hypothetical protein
VVKPSEFELKASLEELGIAFEVESIQMSNAISAHEAQVVRLDCPMFCTSAELV